MVYVTSASRYITSASCYHPHYQRRSSIYICALIPRNFAELAETVPIGQEKERAERASGVTLKVLWLSLFRLHGVLGWSAFCVLTFPGSTYLRSD